MKGTIHPVGGVIHNSTASFLIEEMLTDTVSLEFDEHLKICKNVDHDECYNLENDTWIKGFIKNTDEQFVPDPDAEYSAIMGEIYTQVIASKWYTLCAPCSPCYPGQNDLDTPGDHETFSLPPDLYDPDTDVVPRILKVPTW